MKKKILFLFIFIFGFLVSCSTNKNSNVIIDNPTLKYSYTDEDYKYLKEVITEFNSIIKEGNNEQRFIELDDWLGEEFKNLSCYQSYENLNYYLSGNTKYSDRQEELHDIYLELYEAMIDVYEPIYHSNFKEAYYGSMSDEEIETFIEDKRKEKKCLPLYKEKNELSNKAAAIDDADEMKPILIDIVNVNNKIAKEYGYKNYLEYAYPNVFGRNYSVSDASKVFQNVEDSVYPFTEEVLDKFLNVSYSLSSKDITAINNFENQSYKENINFINSYTSSIDSSVNKYFNDLINSNYLFVATDSNSIGAAFTDYLDKYERPYIYLGLGHYQTTNTFIHEFGHYSAMKTIKGEGDDYDWAEIQSQANEGLFRAFMKKNYPLISSKGLDYLNYYWLYDTLDSIINTACVAAAEIELYQSTNLRETDIDELCKNGISKYFKSLNSKMVNSLSDYAILCSATSPGYYISYTTSGISAISLFKNALADYNSAAKDYFNLLKYGEKGSYSTYLKECNLVSAFDENAVDKLFNINNF